MENTVSSYKCPCCDAPLEFSASNGKMKCSYCDSELDIETVREYNDMVGDGEDDSEKDKASYSAVHSSDDTWDDDSMNVYFCQFCGAKIVTDDTTAAMKCPYCDNNMVFENKLSGEFRPDVIIPFKVTKKQAEDALRKFYEGKFFLPKSFREENRIHEIKGVYVPFWLHDCDTDAHYVYDATRSAVWSDKKYIYTKTDHYLIERRAKIRFERVPADASTKADDTYMEAIEPYNYNDIVPFDKAYLSGFLADKYDVEPSELRPRVEARTGNSADAYLRSTINGYDSVVKKRGSINYRDVRVKYGLFPVWMLNTSYKGKLYQFSMNGQTGKMVGNMPCDSRKYWLTFASAAAGLMVLGTFIGMML